MWHVLDQDAGCAYGLNPVALLDWKLESIVHKVISTSSGTYCTKGDNNLEAGRGSIDRGGISGLVTLPP